MDMPHAHSPQTSLDMYGDDDDAPNPAATSNGGQPADAAKAASPSLDDQVMWEYKWTTNPGADVYGPYSSEQMRDWKDGVPTKCLTASRFLFTAFI
jgi:hypothetical protein